MSANIFGERFTVASFGESHGPGLGGVLDGLPAGLLVNTDAVQAELDRRRPGSTALGTARNEADRVEFLSGLLDGVSLGTPIAFLLRNSDARSTDYDSLKEVYRPGHADRGDRRCARERRAAGQGAVRRHLVVQQRAHA